MAYAEGEDGLIIHTNRPTGANTIINGATCTSVHADTTRLCEVDLCDYYRSIRCEGNKKRMQTSAQRIRA